MLEARPGDPQGYFDLARFYEEKGDAPRAIVDYEHTLELEPSRSSAQNRLAIVLWKQGKRAEAIEHWKAAIAILNKQMNSSQVPETFWTNVRDWQLRWVENLIATKQYPRAQQIVDSMAAQSSDEQKQQLVPVQVRLAALTGTLDTLLDSYRSDPAKMPSTALLRSAGTALTKAGDTASAEKVLEIV